MPSSGHRIVHGKLLVQLQNWHLCHIYSALVSCESLIPWSVLKWCMVQNNSVLDAFKTRLSSVRCTGLFPEVLQTLWNHLRYLRILKGVVRDGKNRSCHESVEKYSLSWVKIFWFLLPPLESSVFKSNGVGWDYRLSALFSSDWRRTAEKYIRKSMEYV